MDYSSVSRFLVKPTTPAKVREAVREVLQQRELRARAMNRELSRRTASPLIGGSAPMQKLREEIHRVVASKARDVLILGETGTGKEVVAKMIAGQADRSGRLIAVHCGAMNSGVVESELFGHVKGAFTGAERDRVGAFEAAGGGYVFLDEIGDMPLPQQAALLRVLQERKVQPVGSNEERACSFRTIAATKVDLEKAVTDRVFRDDLYFRIAREQIRIPPLRERIEDIPELVYHFLTRAAGKRSPAITNEALGLLQAYRWPGNVRELESVTDNLARHCHDGVIRERDVCRALPELAAVSASGTAKVQVGRYGIQMLVGERKRFERAIITAEGDRSRAAEILGMSRATFFRKAKELGLVRDKKLSWRQ